MKALWTAWQKEQFTSVCVCVYSLPECSFTFVVLLKLIERFLCGFSAILLAQSWVKAFLAQALSLSD